MNNVAKNNAKSVLEANKDLDAVYVTQDGNVFTENNRNAADLHASDKELPTPERVTRNQVFQSQSNNNQKKQ